MTNAETWEFYLASEDSLRKNGVTYFPWGVLYTCPLETEHYRFPIWNAADLIQFVTAVPRRDEGALEFNGAPMTRFKLNRTPSDDFTMHRFLFDGQWWQLEYRVVKYS